MKKQLEHRLEQLKAEYESGQNMLKDLAAKESEIKQSMLRISGAIQVLEEELEIFERSGSENQDHQETITETLKN